MYFVLCGQILTIKGQEYISPGPEGLKRLKLGLSSGALVATVLSKLSGNKRMSYTSLSSIVEQVKLDVLSKNHVSENANKRKELARSFISDTITVPTEEMYAYASLATLGDDVYFEPSTAALEAHVAKLTGKEAGVFLPSGIASNQIALRTHLTQPPHSVLVDRRSHINNYEAGGAAFHSAAALITVPPTNQHHLTLQDVKDNIIISDDSHFAPTRLVALENTLNGTIFPQDEISAISEYVHSLGLKMHLDGARIWHVAIETEKTLKELCDPFDSVSLCFSKGLGAPVGSCLVGSKAFIAKARKFRTLFGGSMRQTGILAGCAAYALTHNFQQLPRVHALSKKLQQGFEEIGVKILSRAETCMLFFDPSPVGITVEEIIERAAALPDPVTINGTRLVLHIQTSEAAVDDLLSVVRGLAEEKRGGGIMGTNRQMNGVIKDSYGETPQNTK